MLSAAEILASHREQGYGLNVEVVTIDQVYNEFSSDNRIYVQLGILCECYTKALFLRNAHSIYCSWVMRHLI